MGKNNRSFIEILDELSPSEAKVANYLIKNRKATVTEISREVNISEQEVRNSLNNISRSMKIYRYVRANIEFYVLDKFEMGTIFRDEIFPSGPVIPLVYQLNLLTDKGRTESFKRAIESVVKDGDSVVDLGAGNGIMSIFASKKAKIVNGVEIDPDVFNFADFQIRNFGLQDKIKLHFGDALKFRLDKKADVVICEMLDTGLIDELQIQVMNYAVENLLKRGGKTIPFGVENFVQLIYKDFDIFGMNFPLPHFEAYGNPRNFIPISENKKISSIRFNKTNSEFFERSLKFSVNRDGVINAFRLTTNTILTPDIIIGGSAWLNPPFIFPVTPLKVSRGDKVILDLHYKYGGGIESVRYSVHPVKGESGNETN